MCIQSLSSPIINYDFSSTTNIPYFGPACSTPSTSTFSFPPGNHTITYTVNAGHTCSNTATYSISVATMSLSLTAVTPTNCSYNYCFNAAATTCSLNPLVIFQWQIGGPSGYIYTTYGTSQSICQTLPGPGNYTITVYPDDITSAAQNMTLTVPALTSPTVNISAWHLCYGDTRYG